MAFGEAQLTPGAFFAMTGAEFYSVYQERRWRDPALLAARRAALEAGVLGALLASWGGRFEAPREEDLFRAWTGQEPRVRRRGKRRKRGGSQRELREALRQDGRDV